MILGHSPRLRDAERAVQRGSTTGRRREGAYGAFGRRRWTDAALLADPATLQPSTDTTRMNGMDKHFENIGYLCNFKIKSNGYSVRSDLFCVHSYKNHRKKPERSRDPRTEGRKDGKTEGRKDARRIRQVRDVRISQLQTGWNLNPDLWRDVTS
eukprot:scaffold645_cov247-Pinguiococcus_pyrenoidosus.AAC.37